MYRAAPNLTSSIQAWYYLVISLRVNGQDLTAIIRWNTTHIVMNSGDYWDRLSSDIHSRKNHSCLRDTRKSCLKLLRGQVMKLQVYVVFLWTTTTSLLAKSLATGAYLSMNLSPSLLTRYPPSPLHPSVIKQPAPYMPVGWDWTNSMSWLGSP